MNDVDPSFESDVSSPSTSTKTCSVCGKRLSVHNKIGRCFHHPDPKAEKRQAEREALAASAAKRKSRQHTTSFQTRIPASTGMIITDEGIITNPIPRGRKGYTIQKTRLLELLAGKEKELFDELIKLGREEALYAARYFCLNGEQRKTHEELIKEKSFPSVGGVGWAIVCISSVLRYLDPAFPVSKHSAKTAALISGWVIKHRDLVADSQERLQRREQTLAKIQALGIPGLPDGMPERYFDFYIELAEAWSKNKFAELSSHVRLLSIIATRWGLEDGRFYTLEEIAGAEQVTRERIRQMEQKALRIIGVRSRPSDTS